MSDANPGIEPSELRVHQAAYLRGEGLEPAQIARQLNVDPSSVSRWLARARDQLKILVESHAYQGSDQQREFLRESLCATELTDRLHQFAARYQHLNSGRTIKAVHVVFNGEPFETNEEFDRRAVQFAPACAALTLNFIEAATCLGIGWGRQMRALVSVLTERLRRTTRTGQPKIVFPLWCEAWGPDTGELDSQIFKHRSQLSSSVLAAELGHALNRGLHGAREYSLENVPIALPFPGEDYSARELRLLEKYFLRTSQWKEIFGRESFADPKPGLSEALVNRADLLIVPFGSKGTPSRFLNKEYLTYVLGDERAKRLLALVCGDVGGVLLESYPSKRSSHDAKFLDTIKATWSGVREDDLARCVSRASTPTQPGVVAYGYGKQRARPALEAIRRGVISHLVIDSTLAAELIRLLDDESAR